MKFGHTVKYNGVLYPAGADVPVKEAKKKKKTTADNNEKKETPETDNGEEAPVAEDSGKK